MGEKNQIEQRDDNYVPIAEMGTQVGRNEPCPCGRGIKFKKCCGRFSLYDFNRILTPYISNLSTKDRLVQRVLEYMHKHPLEPLYLANPHPQGEEEFINWTLVGGSNSNWDTTEAVILRRVLAGYLPCGFVRNPEDAKKRGGGNMHYAIDARLLGEVDKEVLDCYVSFAYQEGQMVCKTLRGDFVGTPEGEMFMVQPEDHVLPGMPVPPRTTPVQIAVISYVDQQMDAVERSNLGRMEFQWPDGMKKSFATLEDRSFKDAEEWVLWNFEHHLRAFGTINEQGDTHRGAIVGDTIDCYIGRNEGGLKLLDRIKVIADPSGKYGV